MADDGGTWGVTPEPTSPRDDENRTERRWAIGLLAALVAGVLAVVALLAFLLVDDDDGVDVTTGPDSTPAPTVEPSPSVEPSPAATATPEPTPTATPQATPTATPTTVPTATPTTGPPVTADTPRRAARMWVEAVAEGDTATAWALLGPVSRSEVRSEDRLETMMSELTEGWGAWADAEARELTTAELDTLAGRTFSVVTFAGEIAQEGPLERAADAMPAVTESGSSLVEPFARGIRVIFTAPGDEDDPPMLEPTGPVTVRIPVDAADYWVIVDGDRELELGDPVPDTRRFGISSEGLAPPLTAGAHVVVVVYRSDAVFHADALLFEVEG